MNHLNELSMEMIALQKNIQFPKEITAIFQRCIDTPQLIKEATVLTELGKLAKLTDDVTGINVDFAYIAPQLIAGKYLCSIETPSLATFNPLQPKMLEKVSNLDYTNFKADELLKGAIDLKNVRVSGFYSMIKFMIKFTTEMFDGTLTALELCAVYLHELGHAWTMLEMMGQTIITNTILAEALGKLSPEDTPERVFEVGKAAILMAEGEVPDEIEDFNHIVVAIQIGQERRMQRRLESKFVGDRLVERVADQFAARYMVGASLVTAFSKIERKRNILFSASGYDPKWVGLGANLLNIVSFPFNTLKQGAYRFTLGILKGYSLSIAAPLLKGAMTDKFGDKLGLVDRETPLERTASIRREMVSYLKDPAIDADTRRKILLDIDTIDVELRNVHKYGDAMGKIFTNAYNLAVGRTHAVGQATVQESLANNRLYEAAARLKG